MANSIWEHQFLFKDLKEGLEYVFLLMDMVDSGLIVLVRPDFKLLKSAYEIAGKHRMTIYDGVFLALALETGLELKSLDRRMMSIFSSSASR